MDEDTHPDIGTGICKGRDAYSDAATNADISIDMNMDIMFDACINTDIH